MKLYFILALLTGLAQFSEQTRCGFFEVRGDVFVVGTSKNLYMRRSTSPHFSWMNLPQSCCVTQIHVMKNGAILGVGTNRHLYIRRTPFSAWRHLPHSCCVKDVTTFRSCEGGKTLIVGVGMDGKLYSKTSLYSRWSGPYAHSGTVKAVAGVTGQIYGIGMNNHIYRRPDLAHSTWTHVPGSCCVKDIFVKDSHGHQTYAIGLNHKLYKTTLQNVNRVKWHFQGHRTCCLLSVQVKPRKIDVKLIGIGMDNYLYFKSNLNQPFAKVQESGSVRSITVLNNGLLVGVGMNHHLYVRRALDQNVWHHVPHSCCVKSIAQLSDGKIIGVGMHHQLWIRSKLYGRWIRKIPHSGAVTRIAVDHTSDRIIGIGMDKRLYLRHHLYGKWRGPLHNSGHTIDVKFDSHGILYGVGTNKKIYKKKTRSCTSYWRVIKHSCCVKGIELQ